MHLIALTLGKAGLGNTIRPSPAIACLQADRSGLFAHQQICDKLALSGAESASAQPGNTCNPSPGHGNPGCHVTVTTATPTTAPPATNAPSQGGTRPATAGATATTTAGLATTPGEETTTTGADQSTTISDQDALLAGVTQDSNGLGGGWVALLTGLALLALAGWIAAAVKTGHDRRPAAGVGSSLEPLRFGFAERLSHWFYASCFLTALVSGLLMWAPSTAQWMGTARYAVSQYHGYVGLAMVIVPLLIFLAMDRKSLKKTRADIDRWDADDGRWLRAALTGGMFRKRTMPPQGRFNAGQKLNSHIAAGVTTGFVFTGVLLLLRHHMPYWLTAGVLFAHQVLAVAGVILLVGHVGMAVLTRHGRGGLKAMTKGTLPRDVAREAHPLWYAEWLRQRGAQQQAFWTRDS